MSDRFELACPVPLRHDTIRLAHGGGGRLTRELIERVFAPAFDSSPLRERTDSAVLEGVGRRLAFTTDSYVVRPRFFPGGDIGSLSVIGTVNDLAMAGATPRFLSAAFVIEEGLSIDELRRIVASMREAADVCGVSIVTGDTKVVDRGKGDGIYITTAGVGSVADGLTIAPSQIVAGDAIVVSGDLGRHGVAVLSVREGIGFSGDVASDCAPLHQVVAALLAADVEVHCLRDLTRGGLATALHEIADDGGVDIAIDEPLVAVSDGVRGACEMLGLDPLYVACEGRMVAIVSERSKDRALAVLRAHDPAASVVGRVAPCPEGRRGRVTCRGALGPARVLDLLSGEQLPRIC